jgi:hypothetical protein
MNRWTHRFSRARHAKQRQTNDKCSKKAGKTLRRLVTKLRFTNQIPQLKTPKVLVDELKWQSGRTCS